MSDNRNIARFLPLMARERPDQVAVVMGDGRTPDGGVAYHRQSFAELDRESDAYARGLVDFGIGPGSRVLLMVRPGLELIGLTFALFKAGCVPILIDPAMGRQNLAACIAESHPDALVGVARAHVARLLFRRAFSTVRRNVIVGPGNGWGAARLESLRADGAAAFPVAHADDDTLGAILFTTGSTGIPKGVVYQHGMFNAQVNILRDLYGIAPGEVEMPAFPLFALFNVALGATSAIPPIDPTRPAAADPAAVVECIADLRVTSTFGSPAIWRSVAPYCLDRQITLPHLRRILMAGAPVPLRLHEQFGRILVPPADTHTPYGATEALPIASAPGREILAATAARNDITAGTCVGRAVPGATLRIIALTDDPISAWDDALTLPPNTIGEIVVRGPMVTRSYDGREQATKLAKIPQGDQIWHRMGDVGYLDEEGRLWFCGRKTHRVQTAKTLLFTIPCEAVFNQHPRVARSALVGIPAGSAQRPVIIVEPVAGAMPRNHAERARFTHELLVLGACHSITADIMTVLFHPSFPVDIRHNAKIFREKLAVWAAQQL